MDVSSCAGLFFLKKWPMAVIAQKYKIFFFLPIIVSKSRTRSAFCTPAGMKLPFSPEMTLTYLTFAHISGRAEVGLFFFSRDVRATTWHVVSRTSQVVLRRWRTEFLHAGIFPSGKG
ncbi:MAG: hypothetical protein IJY00_01265 [Bacteroidaceae bacterium]|nr:hypothetical protein [Bacteroidaceae bacterium]